MANLTHRGNMAAAGYKDLSGAISSIIYSRLMEMQTYRRMTVSQWTSPRPFQGVTELGAQIRIGIEPKVEVYEYQRNQTLDVDQPDIEFRTITLNRGFYYNVKVDKVDRNKAEIRQFMNSLSERAGMSLSQKIDPDAIRAAMASILPHNRGANAGADRNINLGTTASPRAITGSNILPFIVDMALTMQNTPSGSEWEPGNMFILMPTMSQVSLMNSPLADVCCASGRPSILLGAPIPNVAGFDIIFYEAQVKQTSGAGYAYPILFGSKDAVAFHQASLENEADVMSERSFGRYTRGLMIYGVGVIYPKKLGLAIATFSA